MLPLFQDNFILVEATSSRFFRVTTSTQQLLFRDSYFFRTAAVFSFFRTVTFSQKLFFQNSFFFGAKILQSSHSLRTGSSLRQLLFGAAIFFGGTLKGYLKKSYFFKAGTSAQHQPFQKSYILEKTDFVENQFPHYYLLFLENCLSRATTFWKDHTFYRSYLFKRATFLQHAFSEEFLFHSYASFPQLHFSFLR